jgi:hypothetical protein
LDPAPPTIKRTDFSTSIVARFTFAQEFALPFSVHRVSVHAEVPVFMKAAFSIIRSIWRDLYFVNTHAVWTGDPTYKVVQLRNRIVDLVESRIAEVTGITDPEEFYVLAPGDDRYALARVRDGKIIEGCYFERGWPGNLNSASHDLQIIPRMLEIRGP